jgi:tRNA A37 threonylcarbamoyladenosine modification protein TsaB
MNYLIIDTATKNLYIALVKDKEVVEELLLEGKNMHSKNALYYNKETRI